MSAPRRYAATVERLGLALLALLPATLTQLAPSHADSRSATYSIHMLATIPSRCALRDVSQIVVLTRDTAYGEHTIDHGRARFRVECNVPYVLDVARRSTRPFTRGYLIPTSADMLGSDLAIPEPIALRADADDDVSCSLSDRFNISAPCNGGADPLAKLLPRAAGQIDIAQPEVIAAQGFLAVGTEDRTVTIELGGRL